MMLRTLAACGLALMLAACGGANEPQAENAESAAAADYERGPHNGRMLRDGDFALEVTIFETGVPPQFQLYAYADGAQPAAETVQARVAQPRLDGRVETLAFQQVEEYLVGAGTVIEPQ